VNSERSPSSTRWVLRAIVLLLALAAPLRAQADLEIHFLDVGQGDATLVREGGKAVLIDAGEYPSIGRKLRSLGVDSLSLAIASHNHVDHIGGFESVLSSFPVRYYMDNGFPATTRTQQRVLELVRDGDITYLNATRRTVALGDAVLQILPPPPVDDENQNDHSVVVIVERGTFRALLSGDSEKPEIRALLTEDSLPHVDVLKAAHHGSRNGLTPRWLTTLKPAVVVISVGQGNPYGHPDPIAVELYRAVAGRVFRTDQDGAVTIFVNKTGCYRVTTEAGGEVPPVAPETADSMRNSARTRVRLSPRRACCKICRKGKACGNSCISRRYTCHQPQGCACNG